MQCSYINGSPQNTNVPGVVDLAKKHGTFIGGDDFKSGQTKMKSVLVDFLVGAGLKVCFKFQVYSKIQKNLKKRDWPAGSES